MPACSGSVWPVEALVRGRFRSGAMGLPGVRPAWQRIRQLGAATLLAWAEEGRWG